MFTLDLITIIFIVICLLLVCWFEFINWFHDTANAIAPVIYTKSLKAKRAVILAWIMNFLWVMIWWIWVAMMIIHLLPLDVIWYQSRVFGIIVVISLIISAIIWNFATWYIWLPSSSSHSLIWSILWVTIAMTFIPIAWDLKVNPNWDKALEVIESLFLSPLVWFALAYVIMFFAYTFIKNKYFFSVPSKKWKTKPKSWLRALLIWSSAWVSFAHGSNDWQKWVGLAVLILVLLAPNFFAINPKTDIPMILPSVNSIERSLDKIDIKLLSEEKLIMLTDMQTALTDIRFALNDLENIDKMKLREDILIFQRNLKEFKSIKPTEAEKKKSKYQCYTYLENVDNQDFEKDYKILVGAVDYAPWWIIFIISLSLWLWTMVWRKRIVVTIWEKIWKAQMNYAQATTSSLITALTISIASRFSLPVSTTHILSSSVAWTMMIWPKSAWIHKSTVKNIAMAWALTLPATIILSALIFLILWVLFI